MIKNYSLFFIAFLCFSLSGYGQILSEPLTSGGLPAGWSKTDVNFGSYARFTNPSSVLTSSTFNASAFASIEVDFEVAKYGSDTNGPITLEYSIDNGSTWIIASNSTTPTSSSYQSNTISIAAASSTMRVRFTRAASPSEKRLRQVEVNGIGTGSTDTELNLASTTYTANEGDGTVSICVDIINESATPTTADIVLTSASTPHVTYATTGITFPANSSAQQCVTVNLADNAICGDATDYTFALQSVSGGSSAIAGDDDETILSVNDDDAINATVINENFSSFGTFTQVSETGATEEWIISGGYAEINGYGEGTQRDWLIYNNAINFNNLSNESLVIDYEERYSGDNVEVFYSTDFNGTFTSANTSSATWTSIGLLDELSSNSSWNDDTKTFDLTGISGSSVYIGFLYEGTENWRIDNVELTAIECSAPASPAITATPNTLSGLDYIIGSGPSVEQSFIVEGVLLTTGIDVTAPTGFLISKTSGGTYTSSVNIPLLDANGSNTIYVTLESGLGINTYSGNITMTNLTAGLATPPSVTVSGEVTAVPTGCLSIFSDDFSGTLSQWSSTGDWTINGGELKHNLSSTESESYIYSDIGTQNLTTKNYEWSVCIRNGNWDVSSNNKFAYFLTSSSLNLLNTPDGYAVGVNQGSSNDLLTLYSVSSGVYTPIVTSTFNWDSDDDVCIRVTRTSAGDWELLYDAGSGEISGGTTNNTTHTTGNYTGQIFDFSSSRAGELWVDDINICAETLVPQPELQLVDDTDTNQNCGFTIDYGNVGTGYISDITFDIENTGTLDLDITSLDITGDYSIVSPSSFPLTITAGNSETVTVRFTPSTLGTRSGALTINNTDTDESTCTVNLTGEGFTPTPEIDIERNTGASIVDGATASTGYNTVFAATTMGNSTTPKTFHVSNEGTADLNLTSIVSSNPSEFPISLNPGATTITAGTEIDFEIIFSPTGVGLRTATITIVSNDADENPYTFNVQGNGNCAGATLTLSPNNGPVGTIVNISSSSTTFGTSTTANLNGISVATNIISNNEIEVTIPAGSETGSLEINDDLGCLSSSLFTIIDQQISDCEGSTGNTPSDLFISEVTDHNSGSHTYVELYNGTGSAINLSNYELRVHGNGSETASGGSATLTGTLANNAVFVVAIGGGDANDGNGSITADFIASSINGVNGNDPIRLYKNTSTWVDVWGLTDLTGDDFTVETKDYTYKRKNSGIIAPSTTWNSNDWDSFTPVDYTNIGSYDFSTGEAPTITLQPLDADFGCEFSASFTINGTESYNESDDTQELAYQWYYNTPGTSTWIEILSGNTNYTGQQSATLNVIDSSSLNGYQYYCQLRENSATCFTASNAVKLEVFVSEWDGTNWSTIPTIDSAVILNGNYDTSIQGSFSACRLIINSGKTLTITDNEYAEVYYNVTNNGTFNIETNGSLIQIDNTNTNTGNISMERTTSIRKLDYVYWSSPVEGFNTNDVSPDSPTNKIYKWNPTTTNTNGSQGNWESAANNTMDPGVGYIIRGPDAFGTTLTDYTATFNNGIPLNGTYNVPISRGTNPTYDDSDAIDDNWNLLGNPYPSAISAEDFLLTNTNLNGYVNIWTHGSLPNTTNTDPYYENFAINYGDDYLTYNSSGSGLGPNTFDGNIAAAQGFMVNMVDGSEATENVIFNNAMRGTGLSNDGFYRNANTEKHRIWLDLIPEGESLERILVGYIENATDEADRMYDADTELSNTNNFYTMIENKAYKIQGLQLPFQITDVIPLGIKTTTASNYTLGIHAVDGLFETDNQNIYLKDNTLGFTHNLSTQPYTFSLDAGTFNERFEIVFTPTTLSVDDNFITENNITITELKNGNVEFRVGNPHTIKHVDIIDVTGRVIYNLQGNNAIEVYDLSKLSQAAYIAKITLSNGQVISKKAIKQK
ncbi:choice-of-anchor D domain-containing protein [Winogradskyella sp. PAMC22761]|nr:choice-of-anchor D domain-containing protein [Winogradskyella sp. PAMC22761]